MAVIVESQSHQVQRTFLIVSIDNSDALPDDRRRSAQGVAAALAGSPQGCVPATPGLASDQVQRMFATQAIEESDRWNSAS